MPTRQPPSIDDEVVQEVEIDPEMDPATSEVTRPSDLGFGRRQGEIEVEMLADEPVKVGDDGMVEVRMADTIEEFTYGNPHVSYKLEEGKRYRLPRHIAAYLWDMGKISTRS